MLRKSLEYQVYFFVPLFISGYLGQQNALRRVFLSTSTPSSFKANSAAIANSIPVAKPRR